MDTATFIKDWQIPDIMSHCNYTVQEDNGPSNLCVSKVVKTGNFLYVDYLIVASNPQHIPPQNVHVMKHTVYDREGHALFSIDHGVKRVVDPAYSYTLGYESDQPMTLTVQYEISWSIITPLGD